MPKMIWLYRCTHCRGQMATESAFTRDESSPAKTIECLCYDQQTLLPARQMSPSELDRWANHGLVCVGAGTADILAGLALQRGTLVDVGIGNILVCTLVSLLDPLLRGMGLLERETRSSREEG